MFNLRFSVDIDLDDLDDIKMDGLDVKVKDDVKDPADVSIRVVDLCSDRSKDKHMGIFAGIKNKGQ